MLEEADRWMTKGFLENPLVRARARESQTDTLCSQACHRRKMELQPQMHN